MSLDRNERGPVGATNADEDQNQSFQESQDFSQTVAQVQAVAGIFGSLAQKYWTAGVPVIPLVPREKRPAVANWSLFRSRMPREDEQSTWLTAHSNGNIGLPLGGRFRGRGLGHRHHRRRRYRGH